MTDDRPAAEAELYDFLRAHGIGWTHHDHPPLFTVEQSRALRGDLPGAHVKNMFLREKKGGLWLVTCLEDRAFRIRDLERAAGARGWSFASAERLWEALRVLPGAVTPFALMNDAARAVRPVLDAGLFQSAIINAHPLHNRATTAISSGDLLRFCALTGHEPLVLDFDALPPPPAEVAAPG